MKGNGYTMRRIAFLWGICFLMLPALSLAQQFPTKPVNIFIGMAAGGAQDPSIRALAGASEKYLGQPFVISNKGGGQGSLAYGLIAKEKPDGYHLVGTSTAGLLYVPHIRKVAYTIDDFVPVLIFAKAPPTGLLVRGDSPWKTLKEFVEYGKKNPGAINYGTSGIGGPPHLAMEFIAKQDGVKWTHVPFKGSSEAFMALLGGHITAQSGGVMEVADYVKTGKVRVLGIHEDKRTKGLPDILTFKELGYDFTAELFYLLSAPKGTPPAVVNKLGDAFHKGMDDPRFIKVTKDKEIEIVYRNSEDTRKFLKEAYVRLERLIKPLNLPKEAD
jgi:tripartite-type tricarboxylate transporter receptor subunit TctC